MSEIAILEAFSGLPDPRRGAGRRHHQALCIALFTLAVSAGCRGFLAIQDWLKSYESELIQLFSPPKGRLPSYSTIRRVLLEVDPQAYEERLARFFKVSPKTGETVSLDGKAVRGSYNTQSGSNQAESHPVIQLVSVYIVEQGVILPMQPVDKKSNEITALPPVLKTLAQKGVVFAFDALNTQKNV